MLQKLVFRTRKPCAGGLIHQWTFFPVESSIQLSSYFAADPSTPPENFTDNPIQLPRAEFDGVLACVREKLEFEDITPPLVEPYPTPGSCRSGRLFGLSRDQIQQTLGFPPNVRDDPDKVRWSWGFKVNGVACGVWDYKGSGDVGQWSYFGPCELIAKVFGASHLDT